MWYFIKIQPGNNNPVVKYSNPLIPSDLYKKKKQQNYRYAIKKVDASGNDKFKMLLSFSPIIARNNNAKIFIIGSITLFFLDNLDAHLFIRSDYFRQFPPR